MMRQTMPRGAALALALAALFPPTATGQVYTWYYLNALSRPDTVVGANVLCVKRFEVLDDSEWESAGMGEMDLVVSYRKADGRWQPVRVLRLRTPRGGGDFDDGEGCLYRNLGVLRPNDLPASVGPNTLIRIQIVERDDYFFPNWTGMLIAGIEYYFTGTSTVGLRDVIDYNSDDIVLDRTVTASRLFDGTSFLCDSAYIQKLELDLVSTVEEVNPSSWALSDTRVLTPSGYSPTSGLRFVDPRETKSGQSAKVILAGLRVNYAGDVVNCVRPILRPISADGTLGAWYFGYYHGSNRTDHWESITMPGKVVTGIKYRFDNRVSGLKVRFANITGGANPTVGTSHSWSDWVGGYAGTMLTLAVPEGKPAVGIMGHCGDQVTFLQLPYATLD